MQSFYRRVFQISLVVFALLFGAGNLIFPLRVGLASGDQSFWSMAGFLLTGVVLPLVGLLAIITFDGDYNAFFGRLGQWWGQLAIFLCMLTIGPVIVMPRIVTVAYEMMAPFLPPLPVWAFAVIFLAMVFAVTYRPTKLLDIIGKILSPLKVTSLLVIILAGVFTGLPAQSIDISKWNLFSMGAIYGYGTLDVLGTVFFGAIVVKLLRIDPEFDLNMRQRIRTAAYASFGAATLLSFVYIGMAALAAFHGQGLESLNEAELFSRISFRVLGTYGAALIGFTVFIACFTTTVALTAVFTEYVYNTIVKKRVSYPKVLSANLMLCVIPASFGLSAIMDFSMPFIKMMYPALIMVVFCNLAYKLWGFRPIKGPVALTLLVMIALTLRTYMMSLAG